MGEVLVYIPFLQNGRTHYMYEGHPCTIIVHHVGKLDTCFYDGFLVWVACRAREVLESTAVYMVKCKKMVLGSLLVVTSC